MDFWIHTEILKNFFDEKKNGYFSFP